MPASIFIAPRVARRRPCVPVGFVWYKARQRLRAIDDQLPDLLITLAASLKAGHSFRAGIQAVVDEGQPPASKEFNRVLTETRLGRPMDDALADMAERVGSKQPLLRRHRRDDPAPGRRQPRRHLRHGRRRRPQPAAVRAEDQRLTAMGRMSAYVLVGVPFFMAGTITLLNTDYMRPALPLRRRGSKLLVVGLVMIGIGSLMLRKIVNFKG